MEDVVERGVKRIWIKERIVSLETSLCAVLVVG